MDETQHFCLRWNNYQSSITSAFENLRDDEDFVDVTLACEGRSIKAHRVVLSACSPYFRDLLKSTPCKHPVILLQDVNFMDLHSLVEFIYHGEVNVHQKSLQSFLKTAEVLRVSGLTQQQAEDTHSHLAQIQNLANAGVRTPLNSHPHPHHGALHDDGGATLFSSRQGQGGAGSPPPPPPQLPQHINNHLLKRMAMLHRGSVSGDETSQALKRLRSSDNGLPSSNNNSPDLQLHAPRSASPQLTPADFSTIKHHNNNNTPPLKEEKRNGPTGNGNSGNSGNGNSGGNNNNNNNNNNNGNGNGNGNSNGISISEKLGSLTPSPLARGVDDVKSEPMELVCSNNNANNPNANDEHSNDSTGEHDANRSSSGDGGKGSLSSGNDDEIGDNLTSHHAPPPFIMSPADNKLFPGAAFNFPISNLDHSALLGLNTQLQQSGELAVSPQGNSPKKLFSCQLCGKLLCSKASLKRHIADKHAVRQEEYRCAICERVYCSRNSLMTHIYTYHKSRPGEMEMRDIKLLSQFNSPI
ncbi:broad-complex core protein isoforms 1/2/3/4/5 isoform X4 [Drosophila albomicans]|uniref:Broad-complex core protein isoforms 1/2/3/4/5 isoform X4 n=1 Tax=Drosophila albomicans TaxID=7291 RepID=A0A9C6SWH2_DROAB|nr:broad-complex core protein isoforms 1/2/3/4/5 isoform X4 [Drosophila albomicans]